MCVGVGVCLCLGLPVIVAVSASITWSLHVRENKLAATALGFDSHVF